MLNKFANALNETVNNENTLTENGAVGYKTSGTALVDFNFKMSSYRNLSDSEIINDFIGVYNEDPMLAVKMVFFTGDIREGMGERRVFNVCMNWLAVNHPDIVNKVIQHIPFYNRWDAVVNLFFVKETHDKALEIISNTLKEDVNMMKANSSISLLAKWMPSINASSNETVAKASSLARALKMSFKEYRKTLSALRKHLNVVEVKMCAKDWGNIDYSAVPSKANLIYKEAFMRNDEKRRFEYLASLEKGETKINSGVAFPYDIIHKYYNFESYYGYITKKDITLEEMWKALPDFVKGNGEDTICMIDGSGSMGSRVGNTDISCHDVARSIGIYFAEKMTGAFHNQFITFSENPRLIKFKDEWGLMEKINECIRHDECSNTNIEKAFKLILSTAIHHNLTQNDMPKSILIISDMEFDAYSVDCGDFGRNDFNAYCKTLFENIADEFKAHGYEMPKLIFWNVCSRTNTIPVKENENGVSLVSGFSPAIASMVFSKKLDPYEIIVDKLNSERYKRIETAF